MKKFLAMLSVCATLMFSMNAQSAVVEGVDIPDAFATMQISEFTFVATPKPCMLRELYVANSLDVFVINNGKIVRKACVTSNNKGDVVLVFEKENFKLDVLKIDKGSFKAIATNTEKYMF